MNNFKKRIHKLLFPTIHNLIEDSYKAQYKTYTTELTLKDVIRQKMKGIRPNRYTENTVLHNYLVSLDDNERLAFLRRAKDVCENETFKKVIESLIIDQEHYSMIEAQNMEEVNFGRATINGLSLLEDQLTELFEMFKSEQSEKDKKLNDEDQFNIL